MLETQKMSLNYLIWNQFNLIVPTNITINDTKSSQKI
jgi:hypothetical protein